MTNSSFYTKLPNRGLIHIEGADRHDFLQRLISNDMNALEPGKALYSCLLTPQGKFLHDFFALEGGEFTMLECEGGKRAQDLYDTLNTYRLRADVQISVEDNTPVSVVFGANNTTGYADPRDPEMGWRSFEKPEGLEEKPFETWDEHRISLCIPDGSRDMIPQKSTLLECNIDKLNGVSFEKGCYVGQEPTARMHYRGLVKKHLYVMQLPPLAGGIESGSEIRAEGKLIGEMRSSCGDVGLALLKDAHVDLLKNGPIQLAGS